MSVEAFLSRLEKVKRTGNGTWLACCPAHADKHPSMSVRELEDGRVLVHCFAGCGVEEILGAAALDFEALFPPKPVEHAPPVRRPYPAADVLEALVLEIGVVSVVAADIAAGKEISALDRDRMRICADRIREARRLALG